MAEEGDVTIVAVIKGTRRVCSCVVAALCALLGACGEMQRQAAGPPQREPALLENHIIAHDGYRLPLLRWQPEGSTQRVVLAVHGYGDHAGAFEALKEPVVQATGTAVYAYTQRGFGDTRNAGLWPGRETLVNDLAMVVTLLRERYPERPLYLIGESMGGAVVLLALRDTLDVDGAIVMAPAVWGLQTMPWYQRMGLWLGVRLFPGASFSGDATQRMMDIVPTDDPEVMRALQRDPLFWKRSRTDTLYYLTQLMTEALERGTGFPVPTLLLYGLKDKIVPQRPVCEWLKKVEATDPEHLRTAIYPDGYHMLTRYTGSDTVLADIAAWLQNGRAALPSGQAREPKRARELVCAKS